MTDASTHAAPAHADDTRARLAVMNFLNEVSADYPAAISFASGRPAERYFDIERWFDAIPRFQQHFAARRGIDARTASGLLGQYGRTNGMINDLVAAQLRCDEGIDAAPERVVVTAGCQEALALCLQALCSGPGDVVLARNPTYIGITGVAALSGVELQPINADDAGVAAAIDAAAQSLAARGKRVRALYLIPSFDNPTGTTLTAAQRSAILDVCCRHRIVVLEDNPYGMFRFEGIDQPPMAANDTRGAVVYLGTYSKTLCPAVRVGCAIVPPTLFGDADAAAQLVDDLGVRKSFFTVNTSQFNQALLGGVLLDQDLSLQQLIEPARQFYRRNRDVLIDALQAELGGIEGIRWNRPEGGFFLTVDLPFEFGADEVAQCASTHGVIPMPLSFFALDASQNRRVRLAFSNQEPDAIAEGVRRFAAFVRERI